MVNELKGEAEFEFRGIKIVMVARMENLATLASATGHPGLPEIYQRFMVLDPSTCMAAVRNFADRAEDEGGNTMKVRPAVEQVLGSMTAMDMAQHLQPALIAVIGPLMGDANDNNAEAEPEKN